MSEPPSVMRRIVKSIVGWRQSGIEAAGRRAVRPQGIEFHNGIGRKETTLWPKDSPVVMVNNVIRRVGAGGQERNCHCRQASQKHSHGSFSIDTEACDDPKSHRQIASTPSADSQPEPLGRIRADECEAPIPDLLASSRPGESSHPVRGAPITTAGGPRRQSPRARASAALIAAAATRRRKPMMMKASIVVFIHHRR
jgi:hypothetical protein